ncbi:MAG: hypothetical protein K9H16_08220 [Bacteroidales bacterium]|nr:hypothetical protein [Bacteroidales bacterium]
MKESKISLAPPRRSSANKNPAYAQMFCCQISAGEVGGNSTGFLPGVSIRKIISDIIPPDDFT